VKSFILVLLIFCSLSAAQNRLYVRVEYNPSMQLLGFGGSGFFYDHILLLPDGTAVRFDDVSEGFDQVLPGNIVLATATAADLANAGGTQGTYQDDGAMVQTSFGVNFATTGEKYSSVMDESGYMLVPPLQPSFITGEYNNFSGTVIGGGLTNTPQVSAADANNYYFYGDGKFGFEESSGVSSNAGNVSTVFSEEGSAAGSFLFEGYNLYLTYNDGTQAVLPAYLWPPYQPFIDQILMVGEDEFLNEEEGSLPIQLLPATGASASPGEQTQTPAQNPLATPQAETQNPLAQPAPTNTTNPLAQPQNESGTTNPLGQGAEQSTNPLATPRPETASGNTLSGTVTPPTGMTLSGAFISVCPYDMVDQNDCVTATLEPSGSYSLELPGAGDYLVMAAMDADGNGALGAGDYVGYTTLNSDGSNAATLDLRLEPYTE
jgi:hypothetical protein